MKVPLTPALSRGSPRRPHPPARHALPRGSLGAPRLFVPREPPRVAARRRTLLLAAGSTSSTTRSGIRRRRKSRF